jgi:hypothetical protein
VNYRVEWVAAPVFLGVPFLILIGPVAVIAVLAIALAVLAALIALAGAVLALPYLLVRSLHRHLAERRESAGAVVTADTETATFRAELSGAHVG